MKSGQGRSLPPFIFLDSSCGVCKERIGWSIQDKDGNLYRVRSGGRLEFIEPMEEFFRHYERHQKQERARRAAVWQKTRDRVAANGDLTEEQWQAILRLQKNKCAYCDKLFNGQRPATKDHVIPIMGEGTHTAENIVAACRRCNSAKNHVANRVMFHQRRYYYRARLKKAKRNPASLGKLRRWYIESTRRWVHSERFLKRVAWVDGAKTEIEDGHKQR